MTAKRLFDIVASACGLLVLSPVLLLIGLLVRLLLGKPVLFRQQRPGLHGLPFVLLKFRTMTERCDATGRLLPDRERLTRFGRFLRKSSLDEFPALINVLRGEMSLVGPRPLLMAYLPLYSREQARRHEMPPGITGWAQVNGRQSLKFSKRLEYDVWYVDHWSFRLDMRILFLTFFRVSSGDGVLPGQDVAEVDDLGFNKCLNSGDRAGRSG